MEPLKGRSRRRMGRAGRDGRDETARRYERSVASKLSWMLADREAMAKSSCPRWAKVL